MDMKCQTMLCEYSSEKVIKVIDGIIYSPIGAIKIKTYVGNGNSEEKEYVDYFIIDTFDDYCSEWLTRRIYLKG